MSDALLQTATIQLKAQSGGGFGSVPVEGGNYITITGGVQQGSTVSLSPVVGGFGAFDGVVIQYAKGDEGVAGSPIEGTSITKSAISPLSTFVIGLGADTLGQHLTFNNTSPRQGRGMSLRRTSNSGGTNRNGGFGYASGRRDARLYIEYWRRFQSDFYELNPVGPEDPNVKHGYVFADGTNEVGLTSTPQPILHVPAGTDSVAMGANSSGSDPNVFNTLGWGNRNDRNVWRHWAQLISLNTHNVADGSIEVWRDNALGIVDKAFMWQGNMQIPATGFKDYRLGHMDTYIDSAVVDYTDYYVATTPARVVLGNASTWSACTHTELQPIPETQWADQSVTGVTLDKGALPSLAGSYLYIIKSDGTPFNENGEAL